MGLLLTAAGAVLALVGLYDMFRTLFLPSGKGMVSSWVTYGIWRIVRSIAGARPSVLSFAGPLAFVSTVLTWGLLITLGFALMYRGHMPESFSYAPGLIPGQNAGLIDAIYLSMVTVATLGFGDITPHADWLRLLVPVQAFVGFLLWTATISWLLSIHPKITSRRVFAREVSLLFEAELATGVDPVTFTSTDETLRILSTLTTGIVAITQDLEQFPVTYFFSANDRRTALPVALLRALDYAGQSSAVDRPDEVRFQAARLSGALDDMASILAARFLFMNDAPAESVFMAYAADHRVDDAG